MGTATVINQTLRSFGRKVYLIKRQGMRMWMVSFEPNGKTYLIDKRDLKIEEMEARKLKTVHEFITATGFERGASKKAVDFQIQQFNIECGDLIADIYGYLGI